MSWQLQEAKQKLSELVRRAEEEGPQVISRHGRDAVVVISVEEFRALKAPTADFKQFLRAAPDLAGLRLRRNRSRGRKVAL